ncbi:hypothetical protein [Methylomarinum vadi]|uniref:hypothetical protein n=1 Tax=Methylomarinum vadi TaxID=438855 RepID=UPI0013647F74|nr:hypothetical protein [Methylomarinum vadi]
MDLLTFSALSPSSSKLKYQVPVVSSCKMSATGFNWQISLILEPVCNPISGKPFHFFMAE